MKNKLHFCLIFIFFFFFNFLNAQTPGLIYKPAGNALGKSVLDPNGDGFASLDAYGYTVGDDDGESELKMIALPKISEEPEGDTSTGASGGHTDNVSNSNGNTLYVLVKTVNGVDYLIVRFRIGKASTASKGYSLMLDTDNVFGNQYSANNNPGFEKEIVLETNNRVAIYSHDASGATLTHSFDVNNYHQRSVAFSTVSGDPDYFYDFFIPLEALNATSLVRILGATITSAQSGISGTASDFSGIDDSAYGNNKQILYNQIIPSFPSVLLDDLREGFTFPLIKSIAPSITSNISANSTSISGVSQEANGTVISVFRNGTEIGTTTVTGNNWVLTGVSGLQVGDVIAATAEASGKSVSDASIAKEVKAVQTCFTPRPQITASANGQQTISGTWSDGTTISANTVQIEIFRADTSTSPHGFTQVFTKSGNPAYVEPNGTWTFSVDLQQTIFSTYTYYARAIKGGCTSGYSNHRIIGNGTVTAVPTLVTSPILASTGNTNITVTNNHTASAILYLYVNGNLVSTSTQVNSGANHIFSIPNLISGDIVYARATGTATTARLSNVSNSVTVAASSVQSVAPQISGTYIAGAGQPVSGTSTEEPGTVIRVFSGATLLGTTTVNAFNNWELTNLSLTSGAVLTATAQADGEIQSPSSAGVTVQASAPAAPSISGSYFVGNTSISGSGGTGTVTIYIDGASIGTTTADGGGNWTLSVPAPEMFRGAVLTATNTVNGIDSAFSNPTTVTGVVSFCITDENDDPVTDKKSGETFTIKITAIDAATCPGSLVTSFNGTVALFSNTWIDPSGTTQNFTNGVLTLNNVSLGGLGPTNIQVINSSDPTAFGSTSLDITDPAIWEGNISTDFGNADNWVFNYVPADGADISFADGINVAETAARDCLLDADRILGSIDFRESPYKLDLNGNRFELRGDVSNSNTTTGSFRSDKTASLDIFGSNTLVTLYFSEDSGLGDFLINRASGSVTLGTPLDIFNLLTVENGTLNTNNQLTLKSISIPETAQVSPVNGEIDGEITIERYVPARRAFRFFSSAVNSTGSIRDNWQEGVNNPNTSTNLNPKPGYGTHITGSTTGNNGFDATGSGNPSLFKLNNAGQQWVVIDNTDVNKIEAGTAYRMLVRGDRSIDVTNNSAPPTETIIRTTGVLQTNDYAPTGLNSTDESFNFVGNPYQRAMDMTSFLSNSSGINTRYYYVWDPTLGGTPIPGEPGGRGAYVAVDVLDNTSNNIASGANKYLQPTQAFFIQSNGIGAADVRFLKRQAAVQQILSSVFRAENKNEINIQLYTTNSYEKGDTPVDAVSIRFTEEDSNASDEQDAAKMINIDENLATSNNGKLHSIERRALPKTDDIIPLFTNQYRQNSYVFSISESGLQNVNAYLHDKYTGDKIMLESEQETLYPFTVSEENPNSKDSDRFEIVFENETLSVQNLDAVSQLNLYPNPTENGKFWITTTGIAKEQLKVSLTNMVGQQLYSGTKEPNSNGLLSLDIPGLDAGVYIVMVSDSSGNTFTTKLIHK